MISSKRPGLRAPLDHAAVVGLILAMCAARASGQGDILHVDANAPPGGDGLNWPNAFDDLQPALSAASTGDEIWIAEGTYHPSQPTDANDPRTATFQLIDGVAIYGGFPTGGGNWTERDPNAYETILSGDIGVIDANADNTYHVVTGSGITDTDNTILDGFTIAEGNGNGGFPYMFGGGMYNDAGSPTVVNCTFSANLGYAMWNYRSSPTVVGCAFTGNPSGGGMTNIEGSPIVTECKFIGNSSLYGGGMDNWRSYPKATDCIFSGNSASHGGGMSNREDSHPIVSNCTFADNTASMKGGGMYTMWAAATATNCTFTGNSARYDGGAIYNGSSDLTITNCAFEGNSAGFSGGGVCKLIASATVTNCTFSANSASEGGGMYNTLGAALSNCTFSNNRATEQGGGIHIYGNPTLRNCILWGNTRSGGTEESAQVYVLGGTPIVKYSCIQGCATYCVDPNDYNTGDDPLFVDPNGPDGDPNTWEDNDYHLSPNSPCVDAGDPNGDYAGQADVDGQGRANGVVDMGSDEIWPNVCYTLTVTINDAGYGDVILDPEPNDANLPAYSAGTLVTLTGAPNGGKSFNKWKVWDAVDPNLFAIDTNNPVTIVMSADRQVKAIFKCGGGGIEPMLPMTFAALGLFWFARRRR